MKDNTWINQQNIWQKSEHKSEMTYYGFVVDLKCVQKYFL